MLSRNQVPLGYEYRRPVRGPSMGPERLPLQWPERLQFPALWRLQDRGPFKGQGFPQPSGGWSRYARGTSFQFAVGSVKVAEPSERKRLRTDEGRGTMDEETNHVTFGGCGFPNTDETMPVASDEGRLPRTNDAASVDSSRSRPDTRDGCLATPAYQA